jgi:hypothetical protein
MKLQIRPLQQPEARARWYDFGLAAVGYESRSRHFFEQFGGGVKAGSACAFETQQVLDYRRNFQFFGAKGFAPIAARAAEIRSWARSVCATENKEPISVVIDVSSMTRQLIAAASFYLFHFAQAAKRSLSVDYVYSLAKFGDIPSTFGPIVFNGPSIDALAGWPGEPALPCGLVLGIGYEDDLAIGMIEELEAAQVWAFRPKDHDARYDAAIDERNRGLFTEISPSNLIRYSIFDPYSVFTSVEGLIGLSKAEYRLIIVPFGPKIFAVASCLAALVHHPAVGFWRVSGGANLEPVDRKPLGTVLGITASLSAQS